MKVQGTEGSGTALGMEWHCSHLLEDEHDLARKEGAGGAGRRSEETTGRHGNVTPATVTLCAGSLAFL